MDYVYALRTGEGRILHFFEDTTGRPQTYSEAHVAGQDLECFCSHYFAQLEIHTHCHVSLIFESVIQG